MLYVGGIVAPHASFDQCGVFRSPVGQHTRLPGKPDFLPVAPDEPIETKGMKRHGVYMCSALHAALRKASDQVFGSIYGVQR